MFGKGCGAYVSFLARDNARAFSCSLENRVRDATFRSLFGEEEKFGSITRSAKLYSTTRAVSQALGRRLKHRKKKPMPISRGPKNALLHRSR